ncbi:hypothetical protein, partial [Parachitinimonas caeni]
GVVRVRLFSSLNRTHPASPCPKTRPGATGNKTSTEPNNQWIGAIEYADFDVLTRLHERIDCFFLKRLDDPYRDESFSPYEISQALAQLLPLLPGSLPWNERERAFLHKLIAVLSFAQQSGKNLLAVAD